MATKVVWGKIEAKSARIERLEATRAWLLAARIAPATKIQLLAINEQQLDEARQG
jgi:hypothetical protein